MNTPPNQPQRPDQNQPYPQYPPQQPQQPYGQPPQQPYGQPQQPYAQPQQPYPPQMPQQPPKKKRKLWPWIVGIIVVLAMCSIVSQTVNSTKTATTSSTTPIATTAATSAATKAAAPTTAPAKPTAKPKPSVATFGDGTYTVGKDIKPGTYRTRESSPGCYYARLKGFGGAVEDIIANNNADNPAIVTIAPTDKGFQSTNCGTWTADLSQITHSKTSFTDGMYIVGTDIEPGTYKSSGQSGCYYARLNGFSNSTDDIIANNNTDSSAIITIAAGDKGFQSNNCGTWTKQ